MVTNNIASTMGFVRLFGWGCECAQAHERIYNNKSHPVTNGFYASTMVYRFGVWLGNYILSLLAGNVNQYPYFDNCADYLSREYGNGNQ